MPGTHTNSQGSFPTARGFIAAPAASAPAIGWAALNVRLLCQTPTVWLPGILAQDNLGKIRENTKHDRDIHSSMEQDRTPQAIRFLHDVSPGQRKREENGKKQISIRGIVH